MHDFQDTSEQEARSFIERPAIDFCGKIATKYHDFVRTPFAKDQLQEIAQEW